MRTVTRGSFQSDEQPSNDARPIVIADNDGDGSIDPAALTGAGSAGTDRSDDAPRRRGRKPGSTNKAKVSSATLSNLETILLSTSLGLAVVAENKYVALDDGEAKALADGIRGVARHYPLLAGRSEKFQDWANLIIVAGTVVGSKVARARQETQQPTRAAVAPPPTVSAPVPRSPSATVHPIPSPPMPRIPAQPAPGQGGYTRPLDNVVSALFSVEVPNSDAPLV